ncbi:MAG TPA: SDR family oxidoreductase [Solirubrobacteraceae bacterium]|jgi:NAD(P)-dependent dehydrogenase (short-subunit alcohol dehydrogenase family)|nr:SDR family oxidoreductase [Solirubrobacteraceae bacterium]
MAASLENPSLRGRVALVTGGSRGIGRMIAEGFVRAGARVYISSRNEQACAETVQELSPHGECIALPADLSSVEGVIGLAGALRDREGALHVLVNNAGRTWGATLEQYPPDAFDRVFAVNVRAVFHLTQQLLGELRAAASPDDPARVINIGSVNGTTVPTFGDLEAAERGESPPMENYAYSASKAAVHMLTRHLAQRLAGEHITVNAIAPGPFPSKMMDFALNDEALRADVIGRVPLGRVGRAENVAGTALHLASPGGAYTTGAILPVDGGLSTG